MGGQTGDAQAPVRGVLLSVQVLGHQTGKVILFANATVCDPLPIAPWQPLLRTLYSNILPELVARTEESPSLPFPPSHLL